MSKYYLIESGNIFNFPAFGAYVGLDSVRATTEPLPPGSNLWDRYYLASEYTDIQCCACNNGAFISGFLFASSNPFKIAWRDYTTSQMPDGTTVTNQYTYDGKTVYYAGAAWFSHVAHWYPDIEPKISSRTYDSSRLAWLMVYGGYTPELDDDPYGPDGESEPGGGDGEFDDPVEPVPIPDPPSISAADTGFITLFNPSLSELKSLANYMWSDLFSVDTFKKLFADPMHAVLGLSIVPVNVPSAGSREVVVGNISTGISMTVAAKQFATVDCGSITVKTHWGAYLDYDPYTKSFIYLPYIGMHPISTDDIMGRTIHIKYNVDILSGACTAFIESSGVVLYQFIGQVSSCIPITGDNFSNVINGILGIAGSVGAMVATGGFSAPASVAEAGLGTAYTAGHFISAGASIGQDIMNMKPSIEKSGAMSGTGGIMGVQKPYLIMMRPNAAIPGGQNQFLGYPAHITARLGDLNGFTQVEIIHLENIPCTEKEQEEILHYLAGGVIL